MNGLMPYFKGLMVWMTVSHYLSLRLLEEADLKGFAWPANRPRSVSNSLRIPSI